MADGEVKIDTKLDTDGLNEGLKDLKVKLNNLGAETEKSTKKEKEFNKELDKTADTADKAGKEVDKAAKKSKNLGDIINTVKNKINTSTVAGIAAAATIKKTVDALNECEAAYRKQQKAEQALQIAAKNNPYLNEESVYNLTNFASALQGMSEIGDEVSLQVMAQLAATGRTEEQIISIMSAAADMAAVTGQDIASAAQQLNATLNGNAGTLGRQIGAISNLTEEELKNGKAIELVAKQYKGAAAETADVGVQLSNAWGDFKENIGSGWTKVTTPVKQFFVDILSDINEAAAAAKNLRGAKDANASGNGTALTYKTELDDATKSLEQMNAKATRAQELLLLNNKELKKTAEFTEFSTWTDSANPIQDFKNLQQQLIKNADEQQAKVDELTAKYNELTKAEKDAADEAAAAAKAEKDATNAAQRDTDAINYINANKKALNDQLEAMRLRSEITGQEIDEQEIYNTYLQSYIDLITKSNGLVTENNSAAKERLASLEKEAQKLKEITDAKEREAAAEKLLNEANALVKDVNGGSLLDQYINEQSELQAMREKLNASEVLDEEQKAEKIRQIDEQMAKNRRDIIAQMGAQIDDYAQKTNEIIQNAASLALDVSNNRMKAELANLEIQYRKGELGEEQYQEKVAEAKKKGAKLQYQIEMAQWSANLLAATSNTAVGVTQALAQGGVAGIITGALVGAAGAVQLASIMAAKPIPHFATGGYIGGMNGASLGADNTIVAARGGELMINAAQQRQLWDVLNGNAGGMGGGINLIVNNSASNLVSTNTQIDKNKIELMIDARVNDGLRAGRFNAGLNAANASMSGDFYGM